RAASHRALHSFPTRRRAGRAAAPRDVARSRHPGRTQKAVRMGAGAAVFRDRATVGATLASRPVRGGRGGWLFATRASLLQVGIPDPQPRQDFALELL